MALKASQVCGYGRPGYHTRPCQVCGAPIEVSPTDSEVYCPTCGSEYEVVVHGSVSVTRGLSAEKLATFTGISLWDEAYIKRIEDTTQKVGTKIMIVSTLYSEPAYTWYEDMRGLSVDILISVAGGAFTLLRTVKMGVTSDTGRPAAGGADIFYTIDKAGTLRFRAEFKGTDKYAGCPPRGHARRFGHAKLRAER